MGKLAAQLCRFQTQRRRIILQQKLHGPGAVFTQLTDSDSHHTTSSPSTHPSIYPSIYSFFLASIHYPSNYYSCVFPPPPLLPPFSFRNSSSSSDIYGSFMEASINDDDSQKQSRQRVHFQPQDGRTDGSMQENPPGHEHGVGHGSALMFHPGGGRGRSGQSSVMEACVNLAKRLTVLMSAPPFCHPAS